MKVYAGSPAAARQYLEADRGRADDYYLAEGSGLARRFTATTEGVQERVALTGASYEARVAGRNPDSGEPRGRLLPGDLLVVDEAGMLDQDTARALLTLADECRLRIALLGDRHQRPAVGRGGVLDLAVQHADPASVLTLDRVHRFTRSDAR